MFGIVKKTVDGKRHWLIGLDGGDKLTMEGGDGPEILNRIDYSAPTNAAVCLIAAGDVVEFEASQIETIGDVARYSFVVRSAVGSGAGPFTIFLDGRLQAIPVPVATCQNPLVFDIGAELERERKQSDEMRKSLKETTDKLAEMRKRLESELANDGGGARLAAIEGEIRQAVNRTGFDNYTGTPDFILAGFLRGCLEAAADMMSVRAEYSIEQIAKQATDKLGEIAGDLGATGGPVGDTGSAETDPMSEFHDAEARYHMLDPAPLLNVIDKNDVAILRAFGIPEKAAIEGDGGGSYGENFDARTV